MPDPAGTPLDYGPPAPAKPFRWPLLLAVWTVGLAVWAGYFMLIGWLLAKILL